MYILRRLATSAVLAIAAGGGPATADMLFTDTTMNLANYSSVGTFTSAASVSISDSNPASPANTLQFTSTFNAPGNPPSFSVALGLANNSFSYDPSIDGAIVSIDASVFKNISTDFTGTGFTDTFHPAIVQDGIVYLASVPLPNFNGPNAPRGTGFLFAAQTGLGASAFDSYDFTTGVTGTAHPNFDGDPILLGLAQLTGVTIHATGNFVTQFQDLTFDIHNHNAPEPGSLALLGACLLALLAPQPGRRRQ